jgi:hypothetical protein
MKHTQYTELAAKLKQGKQRMAQRCKEVAKQYTPEGVEVVYRKSLTGRAKYTTKTLHAPEPKTRRSLYIYLHECAHFYLEHQKRSQPRHRQEYEAERWAMQAMHTAGLAVPKKESQRAKRHVYRKIEQAVKRGAKNIDYEAAQWCGYDLGTFTQR